MIHIRTMYVANNSERRLLTVKVAKDDVEALKKRQREKRKNVS